VHVHSPAMYTSHNNFSAGCSTWSGFLISSISSLIDLWQMTALSS
jgi:hypothetical protein